MDKGRMTTIVERSGSPAAERPRDKWQAIRRGLSRRCPACGIGSMYGRYLKVEHACAHCGTELHHQRADDAPPYFTMLIVGHVVVGGVLSVERQFAPPTWVHMVLWLPLVLGLSLAMLPIVKGGLIGLQWALRMHGFGSGPGPDVPEQLPSAGNLERGR